MKGRYKDMTIKEMLYNDYSKLYELINELNEDELSALRSTIQEVELQRQTEEEIDEDFDFSDWDFGEEDEQWDGMKFIAIPTVPFDD